MDDEVFYIPSLDKELEISSNLELTEEIQRELVNYIGNRKVSGNLMSSWSERDRWNGHDESWTEVQYFCVFRITEDVYEKNKDKSYHLDVRWLKEMTDKAQEYYTTRVYEHGGSNVSYLPKLHWWVENIYLKDVDGIPGYLHLAIAQGDDRAYVN